MAKTSGTNGRPKKTKFKKSKTAPYLINDAANNKENSMMWKE